jgi:hypothetical protein
MSTEDIKDVGSSLTPIAEYTETAAALADLRQRHSGVLYDITVPKQMKAAKEARAELRTLRTSLEKKRVEIKAPALARCRLIDDEAKRITAELVQLEEPIDVQIKVEEARAETERLAKLEAERLRVEAIQQRIDEIRNLPATLVGKPAVIIQGRLAKLKADELSEDEFAEHYVVARDAHTATIARVEQLLQAQIETEAEQKRIAAERAELDKLRREADERRIADERRAAGERAEADRLAQVERDRIAAEQAEANAAEQAERDRLAAEQAEANAAEQAERDRLAAIERGEAMRKAAEERDRLAAERAEQEAALQAERDRQAAEQKRLDEQAAKLRAEQAAAKKKAEADRLANLGLRDAAQAVVENWRGVASPQISQLITDLAAALQNDAAAVKPARAKKAANA